MKKATAFADAPVEKEMPGTTEHRAKSKSDHTIDNNLKAHAKEVLAVDGVPIEFAKDSKERAAQIGIWAREGLRRTHRDKLAARVFAFTREFLIIEKGWMGWTCGEIAAWLECSESLVEKGMARIQKMGLVYSDDLLSRNRDGTLVTEMRRVRPAMPADFVAPKQIEKLRPTTSHRTAGVFCGEDKRFPTGPQGSSAAAAKPLQDKTFQENASNQTFERKQNASQDSESKFSDDELVLIEKEAKSDSDIDAIIRDGENKITSRIHFLRSVRLRLSERLNVSKGDARWQALYVEIDHACARATEAQGRRTEERVRQEEIDNAEKLLTIEEHFQRWKQRWNDEAYHATRWWWIGDNTSAHQVERRARRTAQLAFDQHGRDWANQWPYYRDPPRQPYWDDLPEELQQRAIDYVLEQNAAHPSGGEVA